MNRSLLCCTVLMTSLAAAAPAAAQTFVEPSLNWQAFHVSSDTDAPAAKGYGFGFGKLAKTVNLETQIIYFPKLVETGGGTDVASSHAFYFGGGYVIGPEIRERVRVYGAIGFGELYRKLSLVPTPDLEDPSFTSNSITVDGGIGVIGRFSRCCGVRGEFRRGRAFNLNFSTPDDDSGANGSGVFAGFNIRHSDYWRARIGFVAVFGAPPRVAPPPRR